MSRSPAGFPAILASVLFTCFLAVTFCLQADELQKYEGCTYLEADWADGDSFLVKFPDGSEKVLRLYFVDCIEKSASYVTDIRRLREQSRYFGVEDIRATVDQGEKATQFTIDALSEPFTVFTALAKAPGRTASQRYYAFIHTASGEDLANLLVENGLARTKGIGRMTPGGAPREEQEEILKDLELRAALNHRGIWKHSNPDDLVRMRKEERDELRALEAIDDALTISPPESPLDLNSASLQELVQTGMSELIADRVIQSRPFTSVEELLDVRGIGPKTLATVKPHLRIAE